MSQAAAAFPELERAVEVARRAAEAGAGASLRHWRTALTVERKRDTSPVTVADREAEAAILGVIRETFPGHSVLAEESGAFAGDPDCRWIVDPLDGTRGFARGGSSWGPLVALEHRGEIVAGAMALPAHGLTYWAGRGLGAWRNGQRLRVSAVSRWPDATLSLGQLPGLLDGRHGEGVRALLRSADSARGLGDVAACALLLDGSADAWLETGVQPWDIAACKIVVEEAGGRFSDFAGRDSLAAGEAVATNGLLHAHVLETLGRS